MSLFVLTRHGENCHLGHNPGTSWPQCTSLPKAVIIVNGIARAAVCAAARGDGGGSDNEGGSED
jgi:hypothetical protein